MHQPDRQVPQNRACSPFAGIMIQRLGLHLATSSKIKDFIDFIASKGMVWYRRIRSGEETCYAMISMPGELYTIL